MVQVFLGLGSNLGDPKQQLTHAIQHLSEHKDIQLDQVSRFYQSRPMGPADQPDYVNATVSIFTDLSPETLLDVCQTIEQKQHRERKRHWGERTLDVDILCYGDLIMNSPRLTLPHSGIALRDFVLFPLADIAPEFVIPSLNKSVHQLLTECPSFGATPIPT